MKPRRRWLAVLFMLGLMLVGHAGAAYAQLAAGPAQAQLAAGQAPKALNDPTAGRWTMPESAGLPMTWTVYLTICLVLMSVIGASVVWRWRTTSGG